MAKVVISNTAKSGWVRIELNEYFIGDNGDSVHDIPASNGIRRVCLGKMDGVDYVEIHVEYRNAPMFFTHAEGTGTIKKVDTVNGVAPISISDLRDKILALLP